jgi:ParB family chromosome partitioning protein
MSKLRDKAARISFDDVDAQPTVVTNASTGQGAPGNAHIDRPRTAMGAISASLALGRGIEAENKTLREQVKHFEDATLVEMLDAKQVRPSRYANRISQSFANAEFQALKDEIASAGRNVQAIKVRPAGLDDAGLPTYEIAYGHRRHRCCLELGLRVAAVVEEMSDIELFGQMERENRGRANLSPWEQGVMYKHALDNGLFTSLRKLSNELSVPLAIASTSVQLASLPEDVVMAFESPNDLQFRWVTLLNAALEQRRSEVLAEAKGLASMNPRLPSKQVLDRLLQAAGQAMLEPALPFTAGGKTVGSWDKDRKGNVAIKLKGASLTPAKQEKLRLYIQQLLG